MRKIRLEISSDSSLSRLKSLGVDVYLGEGQFIG